MSYIWTHIQSMTLLESKKNLITIVEEFLLCNSFTFQVFFLELFLLCHHITTLGLTWDLLRVESFLYYILDVHHALLHICEVLIKHHLLIKFIINFTFLQWEVILRNRTPRIF